MHTWHSSQRSPPPIGIVGEVIHACSYHTSKKSLPPAFKGKGRNHMQEKRFDPFLLACRELEIKGFCPYSRNKENRNYFYVCPRADGQVGNCHDCIADYFEMAFEHWMGRRKHLPKRLPRDPHEVKIHRANKGGGS